MMTASRMAIVLRQHPYPDAVVTLDGLGCNIRVNGVHLLYDMTWQTADGQAVPAEWPTFDSPDDGDRVHAEIRRVLAIINAPAETPPTWAEIKADCVGPDLPADDPLYDRATAEQALAKITDAHAVVSQRLIGSQKEVAEVSAERDRERAAAEYAQGLLDAVWSAVGWPEDPYVLDGVPHVQRVVRERDEATARAAKIEDRLRRDDELREQIAVAVGLDGSASLALIFDTVTRDRPAREIARLSGLLDVLAAPVTFGERRLSTVERAEWALRRALRERDECAPRMAQLIDAEVCLDVLGVPAYAAVPGDDPGDASEALTVAERLRLHFAARKDP